MIADSGRCSYLQQLGGGGTFEMGGDDGTTITVEVTQAGGSGPQEFSRHAADLRRFGKDRFVIQVTTRVLHYWLA